MSEDKGPQIIIHKSNWGKQFIFAVIALVVFFALMMKNPSKSDFVQACVKEYLKKGQSMDPSTSNLLSELTTKMFGAWFEPLVEQDDFLIFSSYNVEIDNSLYKMKIKAFGIWGKIIFSEATMQTKQPEKEKQNNQTKQEENQNQPQNESNTQSNQPSGDMDCRGIEYKYENSYSGFKRWASDHGVKEYYQEDGLYFFLNSDGEWQEVHYDVGDGVNGAFY
jgi:hypothetical protein